MKYKWLKIIYNINFQNLQLIKTMLNDLINSNCEPIKEKVLLVVRTSTC